MTETTNGVSTRVSIFTSEEDKKVTYKAVHKPIWVANISPAISKKDLDYGPLNGCQPLFTIYTCLRLRSILEGVYSLHHRHKKK